MKDSTIWFIIWIVSVFGGAALLEWHVKSRWIYGKTINCACVCSDPEPGSGAGGHYKAVDPNDQDSSGGRKTGLGISQEREMVQG